jgi:glutathione S-transferase
MIKLFQFPPAWNLPNASPFCLKLETYLRLSDIPYQIKTIYDPRRAPKGKLPFIIDGDKKIADSGLIIDYLKQTYGDKLDQALSPVQRATAIAVQRLLEDHLYWIVFHSRWADPTGWSEVKNEFFRGMPAPMKWVVPELIRKKFMKVLHGQGTGRFTDDERFMLGKADIDAIVILFAKQPFFCGDKPTSIDCCLWAFLTLLINTPVRSQIQDYVKSLTVLTDYDARMRQQFDEGCKSKIN